jgi:hypothetical protein
VSPVCGYNECFGKMIILTLPAVAMPNIFC